MFSCKTKMTKDVLKELHKTIKIWAIVLTSVGGVGWFILLADKILFNYTNSYFSLLFILSFVLGISYFLIIGINKKNNSKMLEEESEYEFYDTYFIVKTFRNGEQLETIKTYYKDIVKVKETKSYIFINPNRIITYPVGKADLQAGDLLKLKQIFHLPTNKNY